MGKKKVPKIAPYIPEGAEGMTFWYAELWHICTDCLNVSYEKVEPHNNNSIVGTISARCKCGGITEIIHQRVVQLYV